MPLPLDDRFWLDDGRRGLPVGPEPGEQNPEDPVTGPQLRAFDRLLVDCNLLSQCDVLGRVPIGADRHVADSIRTCRPCETGVRVAGRVRCRWTAPPGPAVRQRSLGQRPERSRLRYSRRFLQGFSGSSASVFHKPSDGAGCNVQGRLVQSLLTTHTKIAPLPTNTASRIPA